MSRLESNFPRVFLNAAEKGDIHALETALNNASEFDDINVRDSKGRSGLELAIENGRLDVIEVLLDHGVEIGDSLLHAVDTKFFKAAQKLLDIPQGDSLINSHASENNEEFHPDITPIILAAHQNDYDIIKLLMERGAPPIELSDFATEKHTVQRSVGTLNIYKALASEAYISYTELEKKKRPDPFGRAFELSVELRDLSSTEYEFRQEYTELAEQCEQFAADLLGHTRDAQELRAILNHNSHPGVTEDVRMMDLPSKVLDAVKTEQKKFVAHPYCQQELIERWYRGLPDWRDQSSLRNILFSTIIMIFFPILCLIYVIFPYGKFGRFMRIPYVKFLIHTSSYLYFVFILIMTTQDFRSYGEQDELGQLQQRQMHNQQRGPLPTVFEFLLIIWVLGMVWREIKEIWKTGFLQYISDPWNCFDFVQLGLYLSWMGLRTAAYILVEQERNAESNLSTGDGVLTGTAIPDATVSSTVGVIENFTESTAEQVTQVMSTVPPFSPLVDPDGLLANITRLLEGLVEMVSERLPSDQGGNSQEAPVSLNHSAFDDISYSVPRTDWMQSDPTLLADCVIAVANVISVIRFLRLMVINEYVGPLQISFSKMIKDIIQFMFIFGVIWLAFALGLTEIYWLYAAAEKVTCLQEGGTSSECGHQPFASIASSMESLFWSLYGLVDLEALQVDAEHRSTEVFGYLLFGGYNVAAVVILLNLLIALMGTTYTNISEHSDMEWKYSRSEMWMDYFRHGATLAPPFNIIPTPKSVLRLVQYLINNVFCRKCSKKVKWVSSRKAKAVDDSYKDVCKQLVVRYFAEKASIARDSGEGGAVKEEMMAIKQDLSTIRYEVYGIGQRINQAVDHFNTRGDAISGGIKEVMTQIDSNKLQDNEVLKESRNELMGSTERGNNVLQILERTLSNVQVEQQEQEKRGLTMLTEWFNNLQSEVQTSKEEGTGAIREMQGDFASKEQQRRGMLTTLEDRLTDMQTQILEQERSRLAMADSIRDLTSALENLSSQLKTSRGGRVSEMVQGFESLADPHESATDVAHEDPRPDEEVESRDAPQEDGDEASASSVITV